MTRLGLALVFAGGFTAALAATMPLSLAIDWAGARERGLSARTIAGTIWRGHLEGARFRGLVLGDVDAHADISGMLRGTAAMALQPRQGKFTLVGGRAKGVDGMDMAMDVRDLGLPIPMSGSIGVSNGTVLFEGGSCLQAGGQIVTDAAKQSWGGPELAGELSCAGAAAVAQLRGSDGNATIAMDIAILANGRYHLHSQVTSASPAFRGALSLAGFTEDGNGMTRTDEGSLGS